MSIPGQARSLSGHLWGKIREEIRIVVAAMLGDIVKHALDNALPGSQSASINTTNVATAIGKAIGEAPAYHERRHIPEAVFDQLRQGERFPQGYSDDGRHASPQVIAENVRGRLMANENVQMQPPFDNADRTIIAGLKVHETAARARIARDIMQWAQQHRADTPGTLMERLHPLAEAIRTGTPDD